MLFNECGDRVQYINGEPLLRFKCAWGSARISQPDSLCALGHKYHRLFIYCVANARHLVQECCLFPIQLPSNTHSTASSQRTHTHTHHYCFGVKCARQRCFPIDSIRTQYNSARLPANEKYKYKYKQVAYSLCFNRIMDTAWARDAQRATLSELSLPRRLFITLSFSQSENKFFITPEEEASTMAERAAAAVVDLSEMCLDEIDEGNWRRCHPHCALPLGSPACVRKMRLLSAVPSRSVTTTGTKCAKAKSTSRYLIHRIKLLNKLIIGQ